MTTYFDAYANVKEAGYRRALYEKALDSIRLTDWGEHTACLVINDDGSSEPPDCPEVGIPVYLFRDQGHVGVQENNKRSILDAARLGEWVLVFDSDAVVKPDWVEKMFDLIRVWPDAAGYNLFNSRFHKAVSQDQNYALKDTVQGCGLLIRSADYIPAEADAWETCVWFMGPMQNRQYVVANPSLMNHLGDLGCSNDGTMNDSDPTF